MNKVLSIIIPTYNMEKYLDKCLTSLIVDDVDLMNQLEVLVVIDGATDRSSVIAHGYEERFPDTFRVIDKENGNYGSCINRGLKEANGKYVKVLDADDWFDASIFELYLRRLGTLDVDFILNDSVRITDEGRIIGHVVDSHWFADGMTYSFWDYIEQLGDNMAMHNIAYKKELLTSINYCQTEGTAYTDTEWVFKPIIKASEFFFFGQILYYYRIGRAGQTVNAVEIQKRVGDLVEVAKQLIIWYDESKENDLGHRYQQLRLREYFGWVYVANKCIRKSQVKQFGKWMKSNHRESYRELLTWAYGNEKFHYFLFSVDKIEWMFRSIIEGNLKSFRRELKFASQNYLFSNDYIAKIINKVL